MLYTHEFIRCAILSYNIFNILHLGIWFTKAFSEHIIIYSEVTVDAFMLYVY